MSPSSVYLTVATYDGYCSSCDDVRPLAVLEHGPRGLRAWLAGHGPEDRALSYTCLLCGRCEQVPLTDAEDQEYAATLPTWPDWNPVLQPKAVPPILVAAGDVFGLAAARLPAAPATTVRLPAPRRPQVRIITLPGHRVAATDDHLLAFAVD